MFKLGLCFISEELVSVSFKDSLLFLLMGKGEEDGMSQWERLRIPSVEPGADIFW